jgi:hypothetical protein
MPWDQAEALATLAGQAMTAGRNAPKGHADLKALAKELRRTIDTLHVLDRGHDPYMAETPARLKAAHWFADLYGTLRKKVGIHVRHIFYWLVSQSNPVTVNGKPFENTVECANTLGEAILDARYLDLIPANVIIDRRNPDPVINFFGRSLVAVPEIEVTPGGIERHEFGEDYCAPTLTLPETELLTEPRVGQRYHQEIWIEKSTQNDVVLPLGVRYGVNVCTFQGEVSATACENLIRRAIASGRPVRIHYLSDFDPAGRSMPVAAAVKIDFFAKKSGRELDIRLEPVALTEAQCIEYELPRTPIKEMELRAVKFEAQFGGGATELDALEAKHPGVLRQILIEHIERYYDADLDEAVSEAVDRFREQLERITAEIRDGHADEITAIDEQRRALDLAFEQVRSSAQATYEATVEPTRRAYYAAQAQAMVVFNETLAQARDGIMQMQQDLVDEAEPLIAKMTSEIEEAASDDFDWPEPVEIDEDDDDPLYDSTRSYVEQVDRFRRHQGKDADVRLSRDRAVTKTCLASDCLKLFEATESKQKFCSSACRRRHSRKVDRERRAAQGKTDSGTAA